MKSCLNRAVLCITLFLFVTLSAGAFAGTIDTSDQITLNPSPNKSFIFNGNGSSFTLTLSNVAGIAFGAGALQLPGPSHQGYYSILQNGATITSGGSCGSSCILLNQTKSLVFDLGSKKGGMDLLTGTLQLVDVQQQGTTGTTNNNLVMGLIITGGSLQSKFNSLGGVLQLTLALGSGSLAGLNGLLYAKIHSGTVNPLLLSEPSSLALVGLALISCSVLGKRAILSR